MTKQHPSLGPRNYEAVSIINLIATPERYNGKYVLITGYLNLGYENDVVYLHKDDFEYSIGENSIGINISGETRSSAHYKKCNHKYVFVEGKFYKDQHGMLGFHGILDSINRLEIEQK